VATSGYPFSNGTVAANGCKAWAGWPDVSGIEILRSKLALTTDTAESKRITEQIQKFVIDEGVVGPLGKFVVCAAYGTTLSDVPHSPITVFWNIKKAD